MRTLLILTTVATTLLTAQEREPQPRPTIVRATGEAEVSVRPDQTHLRLAVVSTAGNAEHAREKNAERTTALIARLRELLGQDADIRTANYSLTRNYSGGYIADNMIEVRVHDPAITGKVIDVATKAGANTIGGIESSALDEPHARSEALKQATTQAKANAEAMAAALGLKMVRVVSAETSAPLVPAAILMDGAQSFGHEKRAVDVTTPVESRKVELRAQVTVTLEVAP
jgi:uncharacterized protein YggE